MTRILINHEQTVRVYPSKITRDMVYPWHVWCHL